RFSRDWSSDVCSSDLLFSSCRFFDTKLRNSRLNRLGHSAQLFNLLNQSPSFVRQLGCQAFYIITSRPRVNRFGDFGFFLDINLSISSNSSRKICRKSNGFVQCVSMQRLRSAQRCSHCLDSRTSHVVEWVLFG